MADGDWDSEGFIPVLKNARDDRWEGEDEDDDIKDNWDDEEEEPKSEESDAAKATAVPKKKKNLQAIIAEKEEKKRKELEERMRQKQLEETPKTAEELLAEKLEQQRLQEESELLLVKDAFGDEKKTEGSNLDGMSLSSKEDFDNFKKILVVKLQSAEKSAYYVDFLESTFRELCVTLEADDVKRLSSNLQALYNEKIKAQKVIKGKKKGTKGAALKMERNLMDFADDYDNELEDFM